MDVSEAQSNTEVLTQGSSGDKSVVSKRHPVWVDEDDVDLT